MIRLFKIFVTVVSIGLLPLNAQVTFFRSIGTSNTDVGTDLTTTQSEGYGLLLQSPYNAPFNTQTNIGIVVSNIDGVPTCVREILIDSSCVGAKIIELPTGDFFVLGTATHGNFVNNNEIFLLKTNGAGIPIWCYRYQLTASDLAMDIKPLSDGNFLILGTSSYNVWYEEVLMIKVDPDGEVIWSKKISFPSHELLSSSIAEYSNGDIAIGAVASISLFNDVVIIKMDKNGNLIWQKKYATTYDDDVVKISVNNLNDLYFTGSSVSTTTAWDFYVAKANTNGELQYSKFYDAATDNGEKTRDMELTNDKLVLIGDKGTFEQRNVFLSLLSLEGNIQWAKEYPYSINFTNYPYGLEVVNNNQYAFTADLYTILASREAAFIKTDMNGEAGCHTTNTSFNLLSTQFQESSIDLEHTSVSILKSNLDFVNITPNLTTKTFCENLPPIAFFDSVTSTTNCPDYCMSFTDTSLNNPTEWKWYFEGGTPSSSTVQNPGNVCWSNDGTYHIKLVVKNLFGSDSVDKNIQISTHCLQIPNVFTVNNDGVNDVFTIPGLPQKFELLIYNRWGETVFYSTNPSNMWNGKIDNTGALANAGVYYYVLYDEINHKQYSSFLHLFN